MSAERWRASHTGSTEKAGVLILQPCIALDATKNELDQKIDRA